MVGGSVPGPAEVSGRPRGGFKTTGMQSSLECHGRRDMRVVRLYPHHTAHKQAHAQEGKGIRGRQRFLSKAFRLTHASFLMKPAWEAAAAANDCPTLAVNYKLELRKRRSTLGSKITSAEILVPEKCRVWRGRSILQGPLAGLWQLVPVRGAAKLRRPALVVWGQSGFFICDWWALVDTVLLTLWRGDLPACHPIMSFYLGSPRPR